MKFFVDSANIDEITTAASWGVIKGVTTNPTLYAKNGGSLSDFPQVILQICQILEQSNSALSVHKHKHEHKQGDSSKSSEHSKAVHRPRFSVSAEVTANSADEMVQQGLELSQIHKFVTIKVPMTAQGLKATKILTSQQIPVNVTLVFSVAQAILAVNAGATYISPFIGRFDDIGTNGMAKLTEIIDAVANYYKGPHRSTKVIAASVRSTEHVAGAALAGADIATVPFAVLEQCFQHDLTDQGIAKFDADWAAVK